MVIVVVSSFCVVAAVGFGTAETIVVKICFGDVGGLVVIPSLTLPFRLVLDTALVASSGVVMLFGLDQI